MWNFALNILAILHKEPKPSKILNMAKNIFLVLFLYGNDIYNLNDPFLSYYIDC